MLAYAQDNEITWVNWDLDGRQQSLVAFTQRLIAIRQAHPVLRRRHFFRGEVLNDSGRKDVTWIRADGQEMNEQDWKNHDQLAIGMLINGDATDEVNEHGHPVHDDTLLIVLSNAPDPLDFTLPSLPHRGIWAELVNTGHPELTLLNENCVRLLPFSLVLLRFGRDRRLAVEPNARSADAAARSERDG
jgi:glycogen operon protein